MERYRPLVLRMALIGSSQPAKQPHRREIALLHRCKAHFHPPPRSNTSRGFCWANPAARDRVLGAPACRPLRPETPAGQQGLGQYPARHRPASASALRVTPPFRLGWRRFIAPRAKDAYRGATASDAAGASPVAAWSPQARRPNSLPAQDKIPAQPHPAWPPADLDFSPAVTGVPLVGLGPLAQPLGQRGHAVV